MQAQEESVLMIKGMRSKRPRPESPLPPLALTVATSSSTTAAEFSAGGVSGGCAMMSSSDSATPNMSPSNSSGESTRGRDEEEEDMANCLILLAKGQTHKPSSEAVTAAANMKAATATVDVYQCKTCDKSFPSFQALGGHRASHKKLIKPLASEEKKPLESTILSLQITSKSTRVHECSICGAEFASGQALGGHMRRHRPMPTAATSSSHGGEYSQNQAKRPRTLLPLDLNLPAPEDDDPSETKFPFAPEIIVFSPSPLVDCRY